MPTEPGASTTAEQLPASGEQVSPPANGDGQAPGTPAPAPLTEARVQQLVAEAASRAAREALEQGKNLGRREMQGIKDREVAEIQRKQKLAEARASALDMANLDDSTKEAIELSRLRAESKYHADSEKEQETRAQQEAQQSAAFQTMLETLRDEVSAFGIDPNDNRIDYMAKEANGDYRKGRQIFTNSIKAILKAQQDEAGKKLEADITKAVELKIRKELGLDSTPAPSGGGSLPGKKVTLDELRAVTAEEAKSNVDSGKWALPYGMKI